MSEEKTQSTGKILGGAKLSRENHRAFFEALDYWAIQRKLKWIYADEEKYSTKRDGSRDTDEMEMGNATVMSLIMNQVSDEDMDVISGIRKADEVVKELKRKYEDKRPSKVAQNVKKLFSYQFEKDETIMQAWTSLKRLARELAEEDRNYEHLVKKEEVLYSRLLDALPKEYAVIVDVQRIKKDTVQNMLVELQEKESNLGKKQSSAYLSSHSKSDKKVPRALRRRRLSSSSSSSSSSPVRAPKSSKPQSVYSCHLCGGDHSVKDCPDLDEAVRHISKSRSRSVSKSSKSRDKSRERGWFKPSSSKSSYTSKTRTDSRGRKGKTVTKKRSNLRYSKAYQTESDSGEKEDSSDSDKEEEGRTAKHTRDYKESSVEEDDNESAGMAIETTSGPSHISRLLKSLGSMFRKSLTSVSRTSFLPMLLKMLRHMFRKYSSIVPFLCWAIENIRSRLIKSNASSSSIKSTSACDDDEEIAAFTLDRSKDSWIGDTGATSHMTDDLDLFIDDPKANESGNRKVIVGGGQLAIRGKGIALFRPSNTKLRNVLYVPKLGANLIAVSKLCSPKHIGQFNATSMKIFLKDDPDKIVFQAERKRSGGLYYVKEIAQESFEFAAPASDNTNDTEVVGVKELDPSRQYYRELESKASKDEYILWHNRFGHLGPNKLRQLHDVTTLPDAIQVKYADQHKCDACDIAKSKKYRNHIYQNNTTNPLELVATDTCGPLPRTFEGFRYFLQIVDHYTNRVSAIPTKTRSEAASNLDQWRKEAELQTGLKVKAARSDNAPELLQVVERWSNEDGVSSDPTAPYTSSQNGKAERAIQNTEQLTRALLIQSQLPITFWPYAVRTASYILNRTAVGPTINGKAITPEEAWFKRKPDIKHMRVWGCKCFVHIPDAKRLSKLHPRAEEGIFVGYTKTSSQYRVYLKESKHVKIFDAKCVKFREDVPGGSTIKGDPDFLNLDPVGELEFRHLRSASSNTSSTTPTPTVRFNPTVKIHEPPSEPTGEGPLATRRSGSEPVGAETETGKGEVTTKDSIMIDSGQTPPAKQTAIVKIDKTAKDLGIEKSPIYEDIQTSSKPTVEVQINKIPKDLGIQDTPIFSETPSSSLLNPSRKRTRSENSNEFENRRKMAKILIAHACYIAMLNAEPIHGSKNPVPLPMTYEEAINDPIYGPYWKEAVKIELNALLANGTFEEARKPNDHNIVTAKWVFTVKYAPDGSIERYKARLVARGFSQVYGLDYTETFAPTLRIDSLRILLVIMALEDMEAEQVDITNAFTESELDEVIYMYAPPGLDVKKGRVLRLLRSLYGLKQSARQWNRKCDKALKKLGFAPLKSDPCVYFRPSDGAIIGVYVDDMLILASKGKQAIIDSIKDGLRSQFKIKELGPVKRVLGMQITRIRNKRTVYINQSAYIEKFLHEYAMEKEGYKPTATPMNGYVHMRKTTIDDEQEDRNAYCKRIGSMMFAMVYTRPDVCFAMSKLSQYMSNPGAHHGIAIKQLLRYFRSTASYQLKIGPTKKSPENERIRIYCDSDFGADKDDRRSVLGYVAMFGGCAVSWASRRQKSVSTSTTEAEYMALSAACKQAMWIRSFLMELGRTSYIGMNNHTLRIYEDNEGVLKQVRNPQIHDRSKHIDIAYHYVRERKEFNDIDVKYINTKKMIADGLTKPLAKEAFESFRSMLGLVNVDLKG